jgi:L-asparaginase II
MRHRTGSESEVNTYDGLVPAVEITRGGTVESVHFGAAAVVDHHGHLIAHLGNPGFVTYSRSSLKPIQALPTVERGFPERFGLETRHLALACASHSGEPHHIKTATEILAAIGAGPDDLHCGVHIPLILHPDEPPIPPKSDFSPLHNNCSGKHGAMLTLAHILGSPRKEYLEVDSPPQQAIRQAVIEMLSLDSTPVMIGIDGCSAPNYAVPLAALAQAYARLAWATEHPAAEVPYGAAAARAAGAMRMYPEMVSGTGRLDLAIAAATGGAIFTKAGGEAVECAGVPARGWGITVKVADGAPRAVGPLLIGVLQQLGLLSAEAATALAPLAEPTLRNHRGLAIGTARFIGRLEWN